MSRVIAQSNTPYLNVYPSGTVWSKQICDLFHRTKVSRRYPCQRLHMLFLFRASDRRVLAMAHILAMKRGLSTSSPSSPSSKSTKLVFDRDVCGGQDLLAQSSVPFVSPSELIRLWKTSSIRRRWPNVLHGHKHGLNSVNRRRRCFSGRCVGRTKHLPIAWPYLSPFTVDKKKSSRVHSPGQAVRSFHDPPRNRRAMCGRQEPSRQGPPYLLP